MLRTRADLIRNGWKELLGWRERIKHRRFIYDKNQFVTDDALVTAVFSKQQDYRAVREWTDDDDEHQEELKSIYTIAAFRDRLRKVKMLTQDPTEEQPWIEVTDWREKRGWQYFVDEDGNRITDNNEPKKSIQIFKQKLDQANDVHVYKAVIIFKDEKDIEISREEMKVQTKNAHRIKLERIAKQNPLNQQEKSWVEVNDWQEKKDGHKLVFKNGTIVADNFKTNEYIEAIHKRKRDGVGYEYKATITIKDANGRVIAQRDEIVLPRYMYNKLKKKNPQETQEEKWEKVTDWNQRKGKQIFVFADYYTSVFNQPVIDVLKKKNEGRPGYEYKAVIAILDELGKVIGQREERVWIRNVYYKIFKKLQASQASEKQSGEDTVKNGMKRKRSEESQNETSENSKNSSDIDSSEDENFMAKKKRKTAVSTPISSEQQEPADPQVKLNQSLKQPSSPDIIDLLDEEVSRETKTSKAKNLNFSYFQPAKLPSLVQKKITEDQNRNSITIESSDEEDFISIKKSETDISEKPKISSRQVSANKRDTLSQSLKQPNSPDLMDLSDEEVSHETKIPKAINTNSSYFKPAKLASLSQKIIPQVSTTTTTTTIRNLKKE